MVTQDGMQPEQNNLLYQPLPFDYCHCPWKKNH